MSSRSVQYTEDVFVIAFWFTLVNVETAVFPVVLFVVPIGFSPERDSVFKFDN